MSVSLRKMPDKRRKESVHASQREMVDCLEIDTILLYTMQCTQFNEFYSTNTTLALVPSATSLVVMARVHDYKVMVYS